MKKNIIALALSVIMIFAFTTTCFAASSPVATAAPTENEKTTGDGHGKADYREHGKADYNEKGKQNTSDVSPKTGYATEAALIAMLTAFGITVVSTKKSFE